MRFLASFFDLFVRPCSPRVSWKVHWLLVVPFCFISDCFGYLLDSKTDIFTYIYIYIDIYLYIDIHIYIIVFYVAMGYHPALRIQPMGDIPMFSDPVCAWAMNPSFVFLCCSLQYYHIPLQLIATFLVLYVLES